MEIDFDRDARYWLGVYEIELSRHIGALCTPGSACFDLGSASASTPSYSRTAAPLAWSPWRPIPRRVRACVATWRRIQGWRRGSRFERAGSLTSSPATGSVSIDELAHGPGGFVPDLVKIDVEGKEVAAIRGGAAARRA